MAKQPKRDDTMTEPSIEAASNALDKAATSPGKMTKTDIKVATQDDGTDAPHNTANADAAETMQRNKAVANGDEDGAIAYRHGQGGGAGL